MRQKSMSKKDTAEKAVRDIRRKMRKHYSSEEKIRIDLSGLRGEEMTTNPFSARRHQSRCCFVTSTRFRSPVSESMTDCPNITAPRPRRATATS